MVHPKMKIVIVTIYSLFLVVKNLFDFCGTHKKSYFERYSAEEIKSYRNVRTQE